MLTIERFVRDVFSTVYCLLLFHDLLRPLRVVDRRGVGGVGRAARAGAGGRDRGGARRGAVRGGANLRAGRRLAAGAGLFESQAAAHAGGFLLVTGLALAVGLVVGETLRAGLRRARLEWFDRALGALFGLVRGLALCSVVYLALVTFPVRLAAVEQARTAPALAEGARLLALCTSEELRARFLDAYRRLFA